VGDKGRLLRLEKGEENWIEKIEKHVGREGREQERRHEKRAEVRTRE
jgi:hypothetical protein